MLPFAKLAAEVKIIVADKVIVVVVPGFVRKWNLVIEELVGIVRRKDCIAVVVVVVVAIITNRILIDMRCNFHKAAEVVVAIDFLQI